jgi:diguanylate cyclase (GGDEF)-like protein/PAS domain S-box-containing protein
MLLRSIRGRLLGLVLAAVVPLAALVGGGLWAQWRTDRTVAAQRAIGQARLLAAQVDDRISFLESLLMALRQSVSTNPADRPANNAMLQKLGAELPEFASTVIVYALDGTEVGSSSTPEKLHPNERNQPYFQRVLAGQSPAIGDVMLVRSGRRVINIARAVEDADGHIRGVVSVGLLLDNFQGTLGRVSLPPGSIITIVDENAAILAIGPGDQNRIGQKVTWPHLAERIGAREGSTITRWVDVDGQERINGFSTAHKAPWLVQIGIPTSVAFAVLTTRLKISAAIVIGTLVLAFCVAWLLSGRIARPLRQLGSDAFALAQGDLSHRSQIDTNDEVGTLARTFNQMAQALDTRRQKMHAARRELRQAKDMLSTVIDTLQVAIVCTDTNRNIVLWTRGAERMFGYTADEVVGRNNTITPPERMKEAMEIFRHALRGEAVRDVYVQRRRKDGAMIDVRLALAPMYDADGAVRQVAVAYEDITERRTAEEQLLKLAHFDQLTGLPNRISLQRELARLLAADQTGPTAIALFDLDDFKEVNDTLGHSTGDELLVEVSRRLTDAASECPQVALVSRLGGDEFVVLVPQCGDPRVVGDIVDTMLKRLTEPFILSEQLILLGASAGIAIAPQDGTGVDELVANADLALHQAKSDHSRGQRFFMPVPRAQAHARRSLRLDLRRAFMENEFELYFQPQVRLADGAVVGAEALLRWNHPQRGVLAPGAFIDTLAESSITSAVGRWVIRSTCEKAAVWRAMGLPLARIGVNLFPCQAYDEALPGDVAEALAVCGLPPDALEIEVTENIALNREGSAVLQKLHDMGAKLAFDDFGTGFASLSSLTRLSLSRIKIDRSFVGKITEQARDAAIVRSLIAMAHNLGLGVIAEGVETAAQATFLLNEKCEEAQGYLYAKALPAGDFLAYLRSRKLAAADGRDDDIAPRARRLGKGAR